MAENLLIDPSATKEEKYKNILPQIEALLQAESDLVANLANTAAALKQSMDFFWVGFYVEKNGELVLGPFQGPVACTRISLDKGVCGASFSNKETIIVNDVDKFPGHIACSSESKSEIVVPIIQNEKAVMVLDVDSDNLSDFDKIDKLYLERLATLIASKT